MFRKTATFFCIAIVTLSACAPRYSPNAQKPDSDLTCAEIRSEIQRAQNAREDAASNRGVSAQNVAWFIFFWPGIVANELTNKEVMDKADERIRTLNQIAVAKKCQ